MQAQREPAADAELLLPVGLYLITDDRLSVADRISDTLRQKGAHTAIVSIDLLAHPEKLIEFVAQQRQIHGSVMGIVHLAPLAVIPIPETISEWRDYTQIHAKSLFNLLQICSEDLQKAGQKGRVLAASLLGGYFGRDGEGGSGLPTGGSSNGLLKTLITEWSGIRAKAVDFDTSIEPDAIATHVIEELLLPAGRLEVGYPQGNRTVFHTVPASLNEELEQSEISNWQFEITSDSVVLVTGGARGITAEIAVDLAQSGCSLIVVGRSPLTAETPETATIENAAQLRQALVKSALGSGKSPTPVQIETQLQQLLTQRAIRQNLEKFKRSGAKVEYLSVDVRNAAEFGNLIDGIYSRYGRLDAVIHGAGIIEDKLIVDKTIASFDRVFDTKVDSAFILSRHLRPESLKLLVFFSSVAGRYGNRGQSDYGAANEVVNRLAWQLHKRWPNTRVVAINWGPWDTTGMASEGVKRQFKERGIIPIPLEAGREFFVRELCFGRKQETEVIAGEGPWEAYEAEHGESQNSKVKSQNINSPTLPSFPLLPSQPELQPNGTVTLKHTFSLSSDPYLADHCLDGKPVLPAAGALEWMAEFVQAAWPEWIVSEVRDLRVLRGLVLESEAGRKVVFKGRASTHADAESLQVTAEIVDPDRNIPFYRAFFILRTHLGEAPSVPSLLGSGTDLDTGTAYREYLFHGPKFQLMTSIDCVNPQGIDARVMPSLSYIWVPSRHQNHSHWLFDPGLIDTAPQLAIVWCRIQQNTTALPSRFGKIVRCAKSLLNKPLKIAFRVKQADEYSLVYDAVFTDEDGQVCFYIVDVESTCNSALNRLANS
ncbi:SDR family NAD(P)-dependent oxidoreductase [Planktothrix sp. FACHB-1355]|uniref:SDR family NAD(P)-dependent oxidoreductase n=1 Tax=Aerosakkonema funiforme FACHB-1375 TaxID=2949571 RepID=A0A926VGH3_9CYAN|nr:MULTISPECIES: SDR family NAD(P)-dependent oxidoreductase [Oscillatoriales]MBD2183270.1 SDR family NAD(P)-dependent oxidoreductase [Aerosakkonema funiforme FACHB-1375]MBD3559151.1 SDR family NAD(P)-dependent oxidoreductase [Planktothrix sp. FACHB-1355]